MISTRLLQVSAPSCLPQETNGTKEQKSKTLTRVSGLRFWNCCPYHELYLMIFNLLNFVSTVHLLVDTVNIMNSVAVKKLI